jgi:hypothetical protein
VEVAGPTFVQLAPGQVLGGTPLGAMAGAVATLERGQRQHADSLLQPLLAAWPRGQWDLATSMTPLLAEFNEQLGGDGPGIKALGLCLDFGPRFKLAARLLCADAKSAEANRVRFAALWVRWMDQLEAHDFKLLAEHLRKTAMDAKGDEILAELNLDEPTTRRVIVQAVTVLPALLMPMRVIEEVVEEEEPIEEMPPAKKDKDRDKDKDGGKQGGK